jgi:Uncharacterised protein conserved in bacteria (DUF2336)
VALVTSSHSDGLIDLDDRPGADMTARLLLALTALYVQRPTHTAEEQQQYIELALRLIDKVEAATRTAVAHLLQRHPDAPAEVVARLRGGQSRRDGDQEGGPHYAQGQHSDSDPALADRECAATLTPSDALAAGQLPPSPLAGEGVFGEAFFAASAAERRRLLSLVERVGGDDAEAAADDSERRNGQVDAAALPGQIGEFAHEFGQLIDIPTTLWERILNDPSGEPMVVAAKASGMPIAILQRILLLVSASASYSVERVYDLTELYHGLDGHTARCILALWQRQAKPNDPIPETGLNMADRRHGAPRHTSVASLRSRFGALTARVQDYAVNARADRGSVARRGLRSR